MIDHGDIWPFKDRSVSPINDLIVLGIHVFRMPIFYAIAGFFAALIYLRRGARGLATNRAGRILFPAIIGWLILSPLVKLGFPFSRAALDSSLPDAWRTLWADMRLGMLYGDSTIHLWFLYYLLMFYVAALLLAPAFLRLPERWRNGAQRTFQRALISHWRPAAGLAVDGEGRRHAARSVSDPAADIRPAGAVHGDREGAERRTYPRGLPRLEGSGAPVGLTPEPAQARRDSTRS